MSLRDEFLRLLREDEEFRLAVMGLLGIIDIQSSIRQLISAVNELTRAVQRLAEGQEKLWEEVRALREDQNRLWQENNRINQNIEKLWQEVKALREGQEALRTDVNKLWEENRRINENIEKLWEEVKRIDENIERLWEENKRINEYIEKLWQENNKIWREIRSIRRTLENMTLSIEEEANEVIQYFLRERGIAVETRPTHFNTKYEFDVYGTNGQLTIVGEAKIRAGPSIVRRVVEKIDNAVKAMPDKFPGKIIKVIYCLRAMPGAIEEANRLGIWFLESGRERNSPSI